MKRFHLYSNISVISATSYWLIVSAICLSSTLAYADTKSNSAPKSISYEKERKVEFGIYVLDIDEINVQSQKFLANFFLVLRWKDKTLAHNDPNFRIMPINKVWHPSVILVNRQSRMRTSLPEIVKVDPDGTVTYRQQYIGPLSQRLRLRDFPLDTQTFEIKFAIVGLTKGKEKIKLYQGDFFEHRGAGMAKELSLPDWEIINYQAKVISYKVSELVNIPGFAFTFTAKRHLKYFLWQAMMPLILIVMMSWLPFWVNPEKGELQFAISTSAVLTLIMFRYTLAKMLPALPYLTRMDLLTINSTLLVFAAFLQVACTTLLASSQKLDLALKIDWVCRIVFPLIFIFMIVWSMFL